MPIIKGTNKRDTSDRGTNEDLILLNDRRNKRKDKC